MATSCELPDKSSHVLLQAVLDTLELSTRIKKTPVVVGNCTGFAVNRVFFPYTMASCMLVSEWGKNLLSYATFGKNGGGLKILHNCEQHFFSQGVMGDFVLCCTLSVENRV